MNMLNWSDQVKILGLMRMVNLLVEVGQRRGKNESSTHSTVLSSMHPEHSGVFFNHIPTDTKGLL
jgi:hypothetical protein